VTEKGDHNNDKILVARIHNDDKGAFKSLYGRYWNRIYHFSLRYLHNIEEAEDIVQTVFLNLWINRKTLDENQDIKSYIFKSAVNHVYNIIKRKCIRSRYAETTSQTGLSASDETFEMIVAHDLHIYVNSILENLPEKQKEIFKLSRVHHLTNEEISQKLGISVRTVENHLYRALKFLKEKLHENM
jgi:RNA polymerase sigma-70 factor (ECF subfamily)